MEQCHKICKKVQEQEDYVSPEEYEDDFAPDSLKPSDYSDIGQAKVLTREYGNELRFSTATDYLRFNGEYWVESKQQAVGAMEEFLDVQLEIHSCSIWTGVQRYEPTNKGTDEADFGTETCPRRSSVSSMDDG